MHEVPPAVIAMWVLAALIALAMVLGKD